ncbi:MAG: hypothetical protein JNL28_04650 [Planctomycetes bacterium]|nr:hypothetical protein [Planctomycetota bacterium]
MRAAQGQARTARDARTPRIDAGHRVTSQPIMPVHMSPAAPILVVTKKLTGAELRAFKDRPFADMIKFVVDVRQKKIALGGEMHVDAEAVLLDQGSTQADLWGGNYFPGSKEAECIEYTSLINMRPAQDNTSMLVVNPEVRDAMRAIVFALVGHGEPWS